MSELNLNERIEQNKNFDKCLKPKFPKNMLVELTNICNHKCIFCANRKMTRKKGHMDNNFLLNILNEAYKLGTTEVGFYATGEPFMAPNLEKAILSAKNIGYRYIYITTNGAMANIERTKKLVELGLDSIKFSLNAGMKKTYEMIHGSDDFEKVIRNIKLLSEYRKLENKKFKIYISYIVTRQNEKEKENLIKIIGDYIDEIVFLNVKNGCGLMYEINDILTLDDDNSVENKIPCPLLFKSFHITYEGYLTACCADFQNYLIIGDLNKTSLKKAWNSEEFCEFRKKHIENNVKGTLCYNCIYNKNTRIEPLNLKYATIFDKEKFYDRDNILSRIDGIYV